MMKFRRVFGTNEGMEVLGVILNDLKFGSQELEGKEDLILQNAARKILARCGVWRAQNYFGIVRNIFRGKGLKGLWKMPWIDIEDMEEGDGK